MRIVNSAKNVTISLLVQLIGTILPFVCRTIFIQKMAIEYLGINGVFGNIIGILGLAELGLSTVIAYSMYKPFAENDTQKVKALMNFYKMYYIIVGTLILIIGAALTPFLEMIIGKLPNVENIRIIYLLFILSSTVSYFFSYKRTIIFVDQKDYVNSIITFIFGVVLNVLQICVLLAYPNYIIYILVSIFTTLFQNIVITVYVNKKYPYLKNNKERLSITEIKGLFVGMFAMLTQNLGNILVAGTDNIIISKFIGVSVVGLYSNYYLIVNIFTGIINKMFNGIEASVGSLINSGGEERAYDVFGKMFFIASFLMTAICTCFYILISDFIKVWVGEQFLLDNITVGLIIVMFYMSSIRRTLLTYKITAGLFVRDKYVPLIEGTINLIVSIALAKKMGISGVFLGSIFSGLVTYFWVEPYLVFRYVFKKPVYMYYAKYFFHSGISLIILIVSARLTQAFVVNSYMDFIVKGAICSISVALLYCLLFFKTKEFLFFVEIVKSALVKAKIIKKDLNITE